MSEVHTNRPNPDKPMSAIAHEVVDQALQKKEPPTITVEFEDHGQDFLRWDIKNGIVVGCRPFQEHIWLNTGVLNEKIKPGDKLEIITPRGGGTPTTLNYLVKSVTIKGE